LFLLFLLLPYELQVLESLVVLMSYLFGKVM
jgi:hypothetical protein